MSITNTVSKGGVGLKVIKNSTVETISPQVLKAPMLFFARTCI
jgi:hypothetical protein